jgi:hypothetical protein
MTTRKRAPWLAALALSLSLGPVAATAQDPTQGRTGNDPFDVPGTEGSLLDELGGETQRQLEEQRRRQEQETAEAEENRRALVPDASDFDVSPGGTSGLDVTP